VRPRPPSSAPPRLHPTAIVSKGAKVGRGAVIGVFSFVADDAKVGARCRIQGHTSVWAGVALEEDVFVGPAVVFTNVKRPRAAFVRAPDWDETYVERGATLGAASVLVAPVRVGAFAVVGAGAVVTRDVPPCAVVVGNPARVTGWACACGERMGRGKRRPRTGTRCGACGGGFGARARPARTRQRSEPGQDAPGAERAAPALKAGRARR
jgi:UDP-2-acetamido-3-amino-2,3-dideoxy-glucuronate N-acetyltransferase